MNTLEAIYSRRSIRNLNEKPLAEAYSEGLRYSHGLKKDGIFTKKMPSNAIPLNVSMIAILFLPSAYQSDSSFMPFLLLGKNLRNIRKGPQILYEQL